MPSLSNFSYLRLYSLDQKFIVPLKAKALITLHFLVLFSYFIFACGKAEKKTQIFNLLVGASTSRVGPEAKARSLEFHMDFPCGWQRLRYLSLYLPSRGTRHFRMGDKNLQRCLITVSDVCPN